MKFLYLSLALAGAIFTTSARAETINCTEITSIPIVITVQGVYCLKGNLATSQNFGSIIDIRTNNVTIDFNGFKLGGLAGGLTTIANGVFANNRKNITIRNGSVRGFGTGIHLAQSGGGVSSGHLIEDMLLDGNRKTGIQVQGSGMIIRHNRVVNTGPGDSSTLAFGISTISLSNSVIADNLISGTSESNAAIGIFLSGAALVEVRGNTILDTKDGLATRGIDINNATDITVIGNRVINAAGTGDNGIFNSFGSTGVNCNDNTVAGFTTAISGCDLSVGNNTPP